MAEVSLICAVGFQNLHGVADAYNLLGYFADKYNINKKREWMPEADAGATKGKAGPSGKDGPWIKQIAWNFMNDRYGGWCASTCSGAA